MFTAINNHFNTANKFPTSESFINNADINMHNTTISNGDIGIGVRMLYCTKFMNLSEFKRPTWYLGIQPISIVPCGLGD